MEKQAATDLDNNVGNPLAWWKTKTVSPDALASLLFLFASTLACLVALRWLPASLVDGKYIPVGPDSFYHARRILDAISGSGFYQFDPKIHAPEGSMLTWPWLYDYFIAKLTSLILPMTGNKDPMTVIVYIPTAWVFVNALLLWAIASVIRLTLPLRFMALLCFSFSPLVQELHGVGRIDHHYMEFTMVLLSVLTGMLWFKTSADSYWKSVFFGISLGLAPAINNGLFILQIPVIATLFIFWRKNSTPSKTNCAMLAVGLTSSTLAVLIPSLPFRSGEFSYYYLSWFHLYIAICTSMFVVFVSRVTWVTRNLVTVSALGVLLALPVIHQIALGSQFLTGSIIKYGDIGETSSVLKQFINSGLFVVLQDYSALLILAPVALVLLAMRKYYGQAKENTYFLVYGVFGLFLLLMQQRMQYFGSFFLFLSVFVAFDHIIKVKKPAHWAGLIVLITGSIVPVYWKLSATVPYAKSLDYTYTRQIYEKFNEVCMEDPGIVLSDYDDGNYIRYHTDCSVIANNMIITAQHQEKVNLIERLFSLTTVELLEQEPQIKYIYVRRQDNVLQPKSPSKILKRNPGLRAELLLQGSRFNEHLTLVKELILKSSDNKLVPYARLFKINR